MKQLYKSNYDKYPAVNISGHHCSKGWPESIHTIIRQLVPLQKSKMVIVVECYHGVHVCEIIHNFIQLVHPALTIDASIAMKKEDEVNVLVDKYVTDDPVFGFITPLSLHEFFNENIIQSLRSDIDKYETGIILVAGTGASLIWPDADILVYADMPRWEIQLRFRNNRISNLGIKNEDAEFSYQYKRSYFVDWRVCDRHKRNVMHKCDFFLDTTIENEPRLVTSAAMKQALESFAHRPFRLVPFFDPGPWGGQWLKEVCDLPRDEVNFAWGFDCVPEENSLFINFNRIRFEIPSINLVFEHPEELLGTKVYEAFGAEFPIRFDFLDTMNGGNLSLQVHPLKEYIHEQFGMEYTQDESYYMLDAGADAFVYLGLKENIRPEVMIQELEYAQNEAAWFDADRHVEKWPVKKHDHVLIPSGTVHCSGANSMVLEISATPYIFTFKLWDWGRMGLDGKPRPISLSHGKNVIQWNRTTEWTKENIIGRVEKISEGDGWFEERTGLDETSFIETRRHWFTNKVMHNTNGVVNVLNVVEGREVIVESPSNAFEPFIVHYAETFVVPASAGEYTIRPYGESEGKMCATVKAYIRTEQLKSFFSNGNGKQE